MMSEKVKLFKAVYSNYVRAINSDQWRYWGNYQEESSDGWKFSRMFPHTAKSEAMAERVYQLEDEACAIYHNATAEEKTEMESIDQHHLTEGL